MRKKALTITLVLVVCLLFCLGNDGCEEEGKNSQNGKIYSIEYLTPESVRVVGLEVNSSENSSGWKESGYGDCFDKAIRELGEKYVIKQTTAINYKSSAGSFTKELLLVVEPRD